MEYGFSRPASTTQLSLTEHEIDLLDEGGMQIISVLMSNPSTVQQLAVQLNLCRTKVKFLIDKLLERDVISVYREVHQGNRVRIFYTANVENVALHLSSSAPRQARVSGAHIIVNSLQHNALHMLSRSDVDQPVAMKLSQCKVAPDKVREFISRLEELVKEFGEAEDQTCPDVFALAYMVYPVVDGSMLSEDSASE